MIEISYKKPDTLCIKNADKDILGIYKSINLLEYQFNIIDFVSNPSAARFGNTSQIHIYKVIDKLVRILQGISKNYIRIIGNSFNKLYITFKTVPLALYLQLPETLLRFQHLNQNYQ